MKWPHAAAGTDQNFYPSPACSGRWIVLWYKPYQLVVPCPTKRGLWNAFRSAGRPELCGRHKSVKSQSHIDVWRERVNTVWENRQHVKKLTCAPVNHPPTCSKRVPNASKPIAHRVDTVLATFPKRFPTVCERGPACQTSIQCVFDVYVTCKYLAQRVFSDRSAAFYRATSVRLP